MGTFPECQYTLMIISRSVFLIMRNVTDKICREKQNTRFMFNNFFFRILCRLRDNLGKHCTAGQATYDNMAHAHCMLNTEATNTHSKHVTLIAFPLQQWYHENASMLRYTYSVSFVYFI